MRSHGAALALVLAASCVVASCSEPPPTSGGGAGSGTPPGAAAEAKPAPPPAKPFKVEQSSEDLEFGYSYPAEAAAVPTIVDMLRKDMEQRRADALKMAREDRKTAAESGYPFHAHALDTKWTLAADTPRFLSLRSDVYVFTGGAHGMTAHRTLLWDKRREREVAPDLLMTSRTAFGAAPGEKFCAALDASRAEKRGAPVVRGADDFSKCVDPMKQTLVLQSKDGKVIDSVLILIGPYEAGPYAEGSYEIVMPVDAALLGAIKPEYQGAFAGGA